MSKVGAVLGLPLDLCSIVSLRFMNVTMVSLVLPAITTSLYRNLHFDATEEALVAAGLLPAFPLVSFFGNLYYTDVLSTSAVLYCYLLALRKQYIASALVQRHDLKTITEIA